MVNTKPVITNKIGDLLGKLEKFKAQIILVLYHKKIEDHKSMRKIFHSSVKLISEDSNIDKAFRSMHQSVMTKVKSSVGKNWIVKDIAKNKY